MPLRATASNLFTRGAAHHHLYVPEPEGSSAFCTKLATSVQWRMHTQKVFRMHAHMHGVYLLW